LDRLLDGRAPHRPPHPGRRRALDRIPLYVREGAILPKIPDDVMTLVPQTEYKDQAVKSLDNRRVYEIYPGAATALDYRF
jgi:site-specific DNA-cytosine methylase